jgi:hypothetical protein
MVQHGTGPDLATAVSAKEQPPQPADDLVQQSLLRDVDAIIARLETGIAEANATLNGMLARLTQGRCRHRGNRVCRVGAV